MTMEEQPHHPTYSLLTPGTSDHFSTYQIAIHEDGPEAPDRHPTIPAFAPRKTAKEGQLSENHDLGT